MTVSMFLPPPKIQQMADLDAIAGRYRNDAVAMKWAALHESAHALAAILFERTKVMCIVKPDGSGKTRFYPPSLENHGEFLEEAIISRAGLTGEQVAKCDPDGSHVAAEAMGDYQQSIQEATTYAQEWMNCPPPHLADKIAKFSPQRRIRGIAILKNLSIRESQRCARVLVCEFWPLIEEMAYVALRDLEQNCVWWTGDSRQWVERRVAEIDVGDTRRKTAIRRPDWLKRTAGSRKSKEQLAAVRSLRYRIREACRKNNARRGQLP